MVKVETGIIKTENMSKASFNIPNLDKNLDGGIPYSSNVLLVGQPMSGKSTFLHLRVVNYGGKGLKFD